MGRKKKITVKAIANTRLNAVTSKSGVKRYPLYVQISYNRLTTRMPTRGEFYVTKQEVEKENHPGSEEVKLIKKLASLDLEAKKADFTVRGFAQIYMAYTSNFQDAVKDLIYNRLQNQLQNEMTFSEYHLYSRGESDERRSPEEILGSKLDKFTRELQVIWKWIPQKIQVKDWVFSRSIKEEYYEHLEGSVTYEEREVIIDHIGKAAMEVIRSKTYTY